MTVLDAAGMGSGDVPVGLPAGSAVRYVSYVAEPPAGQGVWVALPPAFQRSAVRVDALSAAIDGASRDALEVLTVPADNHQEAGLLSASREWVSASPAREGRPVQMMKLQGAQVFHVAGRVALIAPQARLEAASAALIESSWYEAELCELERLLSEAWPELEADTPLAFAFDEKSIHKRDELLERYQRIALLRARVARLTPHVYTPHLHPPTLASQIGERYREQTRLIHRHEVLVDQVEVFERVYDACGQRVSDFMLTRSSNTLEWIIIALLLIQVLIWGVEILTTLGN